MAKSNGQIWKWITGIFVTILLAVSIPLVGVIFAYGGRIKQIDYIIKTAEKNEAVSTKNKEDIIGMKKDIAQILTNLEEMDKTADENTKDIIDAIKRIKGGD
jgi:hypothetical protein